MKLERIPDLVVANGCVVVVAEVDVVVDVDVVVAVGVVEDGEAGGGAVVGRPCFSAGNFRKKNSEAKYSVKLIIINSEQINN